MGKLLAAALRVFRLAVIIGTLVLLGALTPKSVAAQTTDPNLVEFVPSPEHYTVTSSGTPVVSRYDLIIYQQGSVDALMVSNLGKPTPQADGVIRVDVTTLFTSWPQPNTSLEARVAAIGPDGTAVSDASNAFVYVCSYALSGTGSSIGASGGSTTVNVTAGGSCGWTAKSPVSWITVTSGASGLGNGSTGISVAANTGGSRSAALSIAGYSYTITQAGATSSSTTTGPTAQLTSPASGSVFTLGSPINVSATASESGGSISRVDFIANGTVIRSLTTSPYAFTWTPQLVGTYSIKAVAYDPAGASATSGTVSISVAASTVSGVTSYLSDRSWTSATNGIGPVEKDRSNGGSAAGDGRTITLNKKTYAKGLGAAALSDIRYPLNGACQTFQADIGVDDEVARKGSVVFQVWSDGVKLYDSGVMTGPAATKAVAVDLTNRQQLALIITDANDGTSNDHGDWAGARVTCSTSTTQPTTTTTTSIYLSDAAWTSATSGWGPVELDRSNGENVGGDGNTLTLNGMTYLKGLGAHSASDIRYALNGGCTTFQAEVGVDDEVGPNGTVVFQVWADGVQLFDSGVMTGSAATQSVNVSVAGRTQLVLVVTDGGDGNAYDHADWANARVACTVL